MVPVWSDHIGGIAPETDNQGGMSQGGIVQTFPSSLFQLGSVQLGSSAEAKLNHIPV